MIKSFDYRRSLAEIETSIREAFDRVLRSGTLLLGPETEAFEREFAEALGIADCVAVSSGTSALHLALRAVGVGPGDEVITVANTCVPTIAAIYACGARPVYVDVNDQDLMMNVRWLEAAMGPRTRCILPVHLWGHAVDMPAVMAIARARGLAVVEDCAQAHFTRIAAKWAGTWGDAGCFSFYPTKNIGSFGDAGAVVVHDPDVGKQLRRLRQYGYDDQRRAVQEGFNARISEMQAAFLRVKLRIYPRWLQRRHNLAELYRRTLQHPDIRHLPVRPGVQPSYHQYVVRCRDRDAVTRNLAAAGIEFGIHYPTPAHHAPGYPEWRSVPHVLTVTGRAAREILSLPIHEGLSEDEVARVGQACMQAVRADVAA